MAKKDLKVRPLRDRVVVRRREETEQKVGSLVVPDSAKEKPQEAEVMAVGPGKLDEAGKRMPMDVKKGNRVLIGKYSGQDIKVDDVEHTIVREDEIFAIVRK